MGIPWEDLLSGGVGSRSGRGHRWPWRCLSGGGNRLWVKSTAISRGRGRLAHLGVPAPTVFPPYPWARDPWERAWQVREGPGPLSLVGGVGVGMGRLHLGWRLWWPGPYFKVDTKVGWPSPHPLTQVTRVGLSGDMSGPSRQGVRPVDTWFSLSRKVSLGLLPCRTHVL